MKSSLAQIIKNLRSPRLVVVGDVILDCYIRGAVDRISPEAPASVLDVTDEEMMLGGAANTAAGVTAFGGKARLLGVVGNDEQADSLRQIMKQAGLPTNGLVTDKDRPTTRKTRFMALRQQMLRVDHEERRPIAGTVATALITKTITAIEASDAVIISDYGKGTLPKALLKKIITAARKAKKPIIVDPKGDDYSRYQGVTLITPNKKEAAAATGIDITTEADYNRAAQKLIAITGAKNILITRGEEGMSLFGKNEKPVHLPAEALEVFDVSGAGDTVIAVLAVVFAAGYDLADAARIANVAASIEVAHLGARAVTRAETNDKLAPPSPGSEKIMTQTQAAAYAAKARNDGRRVVFTNGCFDILHAGHVDYLHKARQQGDILIVGLNSDASVRRLDKGKNRPLMNESDRAALLAAMSMIDVIVSFNEETPEKLIEAIQPDVLVKGGDYKPASVVGRTWVEAQGGKVVIVPFVKGKSTTALIDKIVRSHHE